MKYIILFVIIESMLAITICTKIYTDSNAWIYMAGITAVGVAMFANFVMRDTRS